MIIQNKIKIFVDAKLQVYQILRKVIIHEKLNLNSISTET